MSSIIADVEMDLTPANLSKNKNLIRRFYKDLWDKQDLSLIPEVFHENFTFRGSLGPVLVGHEQFGSYVTWLTNTLEGYTSDIFELIEEGDKVSGRLCFHGIHRKEFFGCPPTDKEVWWYGSPIFTFEEDKVKDLWVLGDIFGLVNRMSNASDPIEFAA